MNIKIYKKGQRTPITQNFFSTEFDCNCNDPACTWTHIDEDHVKKLQEIRNKTKRKIKINCGFRCPKHNAEVGGVKNSQHLLGTATDIVIEGLTPEEAARELEGFSGLGIYDTFIHVDSREVKSRWDFRRDKK